MDVLLSNYFWDGKEAINLLQLNINLFFDNIIEGDFQK